MHILHLSQLSPGNYQGGRYPQGGSYPGQGGSYPGQGGSYPGQGGSYPGQGGSYPGYSGQGQSGYKNPHQNQHRTNGGSSSFGDSLTDSLKSIGTKILTDAIGTSILLIFIDYVFYLLQGYSVF